MSRVKVIRQRIDRGLRFGRQHHESPPPRFVPKPTVSCAANRQDRTCGLRLFRFGRGRVDRRARRRADAVDRIGRGFSAADHFGAAYCRRVCRRLCLLVERRRAVAARESGGFRRNAAARICVCRAGGSAYRVHRRPARAQPGNWSAANGLPQPCFSNPWPASSAAARWPCC